MIFKKVCLEQGTFTSDDQELMRRIVSDQLFCEGKRERDWLLKELVLAVSVCHNVTPAEGGQL
jgi:hypothetical protein